MFYTLLAEHWGQRAVQNLATAKAAFNLPRLTVLICILWPGWPTKLNNMFLLWAGGIRKGLHQQKKNAVSTVCASVLVA
jgi:hypothetical protein